MKRDDPALIVSPHPITLDGQREYGPAVMIPGDTLASLLGRHGVNAGRGWVATIGGVPVPDKQWHLVRPKNGHLIEARNAAHNQNVLRVVAVAVLSYYTLGAGASAGWASGLSSGAAMAWGTAAFIAGSIIINKLLPPKMPGIPGAGSNRDRATYSVSGARNSARPFETMALVLGEPYCVPDVAAKPYTYFEGDEQHLWQVFHLGINCADYTDLRNGQTPFTSYSDVVISRQGFASGNTGLALQTNVETSEGAVLTAPSSPGPWVRRTSAINSGRLAVDLEGTIFKVDGATGAYASVTVRIESEYRPVLDGQGDEDNWETFAVSPPVERTTDAYFYFENDPVTGEAVRVDVPAVTYIHTPAYIEMISASTRPVRVTYSRQVDPGQYEIRLRKRTEDSTSSSRSNTVTWAALKSYQADTNTYPGQSLIGIQVRASGQLSGALDEVNCKAVAGPMPYWDGANWTTATNRANGLCNPGAQLLLLARGIYDDDDVLLAGLGLDDSMIDIESLQGLMVHCESNDLTFSLFQQGQVSSIDLMDQIAYSAMAAISWHTGKFGVIWFEQDEPLRGVVNMAAMSANSFSVTYDTAETADELEVQYFDRALDTWRTIRVTSPLVETPENTGRLSLTGVDNETQAAALGRFAMAQNIYQRKTIACGVDLEHLTFRRGTVMALSHDLTQWGYGGRIQAASMDTSSIVTLTLDEPIPAVGPSGQTTRYIGLRLAGERQFRIFPIESFVGDTKTVTLSEEWPDGISIPGSSASNPAHDALWIYDFKETPGQMVRVAGIEPVGNLLGANVTFVPESEEFWDYVWNGTYSPPPSTTLLQPLPSISNLQISERLLLDGNVFAVEISITFEISGSYGGAELRGATVQDGDEDTDIETIITGTLTTKRLAETNNATISFVSTGITDRWLFKLTPFSIAELAGAPAFIDYTVRGKSAPPADVTNFRINGLDLSWNPVPDVDLAGYVIRFNSAADTWWPTATPLHDGLLTESPYTIVNRPSGVVTFLIKAVDTSGNESLNAASISINLGDTGITNIIFREDQHHDFTGTKTNCYVDSSGTLVAVDTDEFFFPPESSAFLPANEEAFGGGQFAQMVYEWEFDAPSSGTITLEYSIHASGMLIEFKMGDQSLAFAPLTDDAFSPADELFFGEPGDWQIWPGSLVLNGEQIIYFRITLDGGGTQGQISALTTVMDVEDVLEYFNDFAIAPGGTRVPLAKEYRAIRFIGLSLQSDGGDGVSARWIDRNILPGPLIEVVDGSGVSVAGVVDVEIQGY